MNFALLDPLFIEWLVDKNGSTIWLIKDEGTSHMMCTHTLISNLFGCSTFILHDCPNCLSLMPICIFIIPDNKLHG